MEAARIDPAKLLERHQSGDWGDLEEEDWRENDFAVNRRLRTFSAYGQPPDRLGHHRSRSVGDHDPAT
jgi:hypothetical protein